MDLIRVLIWMTMGGVATYWFISKFFILTSIYKKEDEINEQHTEPEQEDEYFEPVDDDFDNEDSDDDVYYYVKIRGYERPVRIRVEERLERNHYVVIKDKTYFVYDIIHKVNGHSLYVLEPKFQG